MGYVSSHPLAYAWVTEENHEYRNQVNQSSSRYLMHQLFP
jgi:hypothetical protein